MEGSAVEDERVEGGGFGLRLEETELRLGLPGGDSEPVKSGAKRGFSETIDLKLKLEASLGHGDGAGLTADDWKKKDEDHEKIPASKAQVVGWPPVRSFRKNILSEKTTRSSKKEDGEKPGGGGGGGAAMVKVSMDGAPYLRKVDLKTCSSYKELSEALEAMFRSFTGGKCGPNARDFLNEGKLMDLLDGSKYVPTYEDGDGDWMLVGDVPWEMFVVSCRRLRIIHSSEAVGLAPRAMEKQRSRS